MTAGSTHRLAAVALAMMLVGGRSAAAQEPAALQVFVGWAPAFADEVEYHVLPAWTVSFDRGDRRVTPVLDVTGWYFSSDQSIHTFMGGPRFAFPTASGARGFVHMLGGVTVFHATGTGYGLAFAPGGGVDVPIKGSRAALRVQGDWFGEWAPGDYGRHYLGHLWRASTGIVFLPRK